MKQRVDNDSLIILHLNTMMSYLINKKRCTYEDAMELVLLSKTYHALLTDKLYRSQGSLYVLNDFIAEYNQALQA